MKPYVPNVEAMKARLEKNKERTSKKERTSIYEDPTLKVEGPGKYKFRATHYPHGEDPAAEPFPMRHYHYRVPGGGTVYCPQMNEGEKCHVCDFVWGMMKENKGINKDEVKKWAEYLPKGRIWIPGLLRDYEVDGEKMERSKEGVKFFSVGTSIEDHSEKHLKIIGWFYDEDRSQWLSHEKGEFGGFDMEITYKEMKPEQAKRFKKSFGLSDISLRSRSTDFGKKGEYEAFLESIPNIDDNDLPILSAYSRKTSEDTLDILGKWKESLERKLGGSVSKTREASADTADQVDDDETSEEPEVASKSVSDLRAKLRSMGVTK